MKLRCPSEARGLSLVEMLAGLALLCLLAALAWPSWHAVNSKLRRNQAKAALTRAMLQQEQHYSRHQRYAAFSRHSPQGFSWYSGSTPSSSSHELHAEACPGFTLEQCVRITATPGTTRVNPSASDAHCGSFHLDSRGMHGANASGCWD